MWITEVETKNAYDVCQWTITWLSSCQTNFTSGHIMLCLYVIHLRCKRDQ